MAFDNLVKRRVLFDGEKKLQKVGIKFKFRQHSAPLSRGGVFRGLLSRTGGRAAAAHRQPERHSEGFHRQGGRQLPDGDLNPRRRGNFEKQKGLIKSLPSLIQTEFGKSFQVDFDGVTSIEADSAVYQEHRAIRQVKEERKRVVEEIETYESKNFEGKRKDTALLPFGKGTTCIPRWCSPPQRCFMASP